MAAMALCIHSASSSRYIPSVMMPVPSSSLMYGMSRVAIVMAGMGWFVFVIFFGGRVGVIARGPGATRRCRAEEGAFRFDVPADDATRG